VNRFLAGLFLLSIAGLAMIGCVGSPCPNNDNQNCFTDLTGLVCNEAVRCPTGACGTCQFPGEQDDLCAEQADCAEGYLCEIDASGLCKGDQGTYCETRDDCYLDLSCLDSICN